jgi:iron-sulfur cluster assembly protein
MAIQLTPAALARVQQFTANDIEAIGLRFGVRKVGCSGFAYVVDVAKQLNADDQVFEIDGVKVVVDSKSLPVVRGTEIDFRRQGLNSTFAFANPNMTGECGCGESFSIDKAAI